MIAGSPNREQKEKNGIRGRRSGGREQMLSVAVAMGCGRERGGGGRSIDGGGKFGVLRNDGLLVSARS